ncbi:MAG: copper ion binding protein [Clostridiales bacterium]|nr:copper ion binding protein [Clostridiales bacterium]
MQKYEIKIDGMSCNHCTASVQKALTALDGVMSVDVSLEKATATVEYDEEHTNEEIFKNVIQDLGYSVI